MVYSPGSLYISDAGPYNLVFIFYELPGLCSEPAKCFDG